MRVLGRSCAVAGTLAALAAGALVWASPVGAQEGPPPGFGPPDARAEEALRVWEPEGELARVKALLASGRASAYLYALHAKLLFHAGRYEEALRSAREAERLAPHEERVKGLAAWVQRALEARKGFRVYPGRRFEIHLDPEQDGLLAEAALETAERSHEVLAPFFGVPPEGAGRVRIEVYPTAEKFHWASGLSRRDIEVTGAVGITAYNKVMLISPRALVQGYRWPDTLSHEYVHYLLTRATRNNAPIWFHEGLAKFLETRWRASEDLHLRPVSRTLLAEAARDGEFVSFKEMEPSLVHLPNPRLVQLAYAEGASAVAFILKHHGREKLVEVFRHLASSPERTLAEAFQRVLGLSVEEFERAWKEDLRAQKLEPVEGVWLPTYKVRGGDTREEVEEYRAIRSAVARNHLRLGDLLWSRGRQRPAIMEYARAVHESPAMPYLRNSLARRLMALGREEAALDQLEAARRLAPDYGPTYTLLGHVHLRFGRFAEAKAAYLESFQINPFDPSIHQGLALAYGRLGEAQKAERAEKTFRRLVRGEGPRPDGTGSKME